MTSSLVRLREAIFDLRVNDADWRKGIAEAYAELHPGSAHTAVVDLELSPKGPRTISVSPPQPALAAVIHAACRLISAEDAQHLFESARRLETFEESMKDRPAAGVWTRVPRALGFRPANLVGFATFDGGSRVLSVATPRGPGATIPDEVKADLRPLVAHLATLFRLRRMLAGRRVRPELGEAVITPDGRVQHAEGPAKTPAARAHLAACVAKARVGGRLWEPLVAGRWSLVDCWDSDGRQFYVAIRNDPRFTSTHALTERETQVSRMAAQGLLNKEIAYALGISESTVATHLRRALEKLGVKHRAALPILYEESARPLPGLPEVVAITSSLRSSRLTAAELEVVKLAGLGHSNDEIAARRRSSTRTVANLLYRAFKKLGVSSRTEAIAALSRSR